MTITYHEEVTQGSDEWLALRCGLLTASEMKLIVTPTFKAASNDKEKAHLYELLGQRITKYVEPRYIGDDMLRGLNDEIEALALYEKNYAKVKRIGFMTNDKFGFIIGYSPDGLVGDDGQVECKSRAAKFQVQTIIDGIIPPEFMIQLQTGLLVSERKWVDFVSYSGGLPMFVLRCYPIETVQDAIIAAAQNFELRLSEKLEAYLNASNGMIQTERKIEVQMF